MINLAELRLLQFCDSQVPTGAFSHSFGLETYIQRGDVHDGDTFLAWLRMFLNEQLTYSDGLAIRLIHKALEAHDESRIIEVDRLLFVQNLPKETRIGSKQMGTRMMKLSLELYEDMSWMRWYSEAFKEKKVMTHPSICFTMVGHYLKLPVKKIIDYYLYQNVSSLTQNAVRAIPLGQTKGQQIITQVIPTIESIRERIMQLDVTDFGLTAPGLEMNQMEHEDVNVRIFIS